MSKRKPATFGQAGGPGLSDLHLPTGQLLVAALSEWRRAPTPADVNVGYLGTVYVVPSALARSWAALHSTDLIAGAELGGRKKVRLRGIVTLDGRQWTPTGPLVAHGDTDARPELDLASLSLTELLEADTVEEGIAGRLYSFAQRMDPTVVEQLGRNLHAIGPVYPKAGEERLALGFNARVFPVEELMLGQWFSLPVTFLHATDRPAAAA